MPRNLDDLDPSLLADLDQEQEFAKSQQRRKYMPKVKIERGHSVLLRFLPVEIGTNKHWLGRFAQHWVHQRPITCIEKTSEHLGGDRNHKCKICQLVENGIASKNAGVKKRAEESFAEPFWFGVPLILARDTGQGRPTAIPAPQCYTAHLFNMYRTQFEQVRLIASRCAVKGTKGMVDLEKGVDIWVTRGGRGYSWQQQAPAPVWGDGEDPQSVINQIWSTIILPDITIPDDAQIAEYFGKIKEFILTGGGAWENNRGGGSPRGNGHVTDDLAEDGMGAAPVNAPAFSRGRPLAAPLAAEQPAAEEELNLEAGIESAEPPPPAARPTVPTTPQVTAPPPAAPVTAAPAAPTVAAAPPVVTTPPRVAGSKLVAPPAAKPPAVSAQPATPAVPLTPPPQPPEHEAEEGDPAVEHVDAAPPINANLEEPAAPAPTTAPVVQPPPVSAPPKVNAAGSRRLTGALSQRLAAFTPPK